MPDDPAHLAQVDLGRERVARRHRGEGEEAVQLARGGGQELAVHRQHLGTELDRPERRPCDHGLDLVQPELEPGHDAEVAAAATQRPEQVGVLVLAGAHELAVGQHDLGGEQVVDRQPARARQVPEPTAERDPAHAGRGDDAARRGQPVRVRRAVELAQRAAAADPRRARGGVHVDAVHGGEVDHQPAVAGAQPRAVVAAAANGQRELALAREGDRAAPRPAPGAAHDQLRAPVDQRVVDRACLLVVGIARPDHPAFEARRGAAHRCLRGRRCPPTLEPARSRGITRADRLSRARVGMSEPTSDHF